jgi:hypothetical protein
MNGPLAATGAALWSWFAPRGEPVSQVAERPPPALRRTFTLRVDVPAFGLRRGQPFEIYPDAPIYLNDVVALRSDGGGIVLARYRDDFIGCVAGLVRPARELR